MDWLLALLVAGVPAAITSISLIAQQRYNARSAERADESRRLDAEAERQHQERLLEATNNHARERADQDHRRQVRDAWKVDRRTSHARLLTRLEEIQSASQSALSSVTVDLSIGEEVGKKKFAIPQLPQEYVSDVALLCSDKSAEAAQKASGAVAQLGVSVLMIEVFATDRTKEQLNSDLAKAQRHLAALRTALTAYRQAAKQDIDTVD
jgi:hypothetical protein